MLQKVENSGRASATIPNWDFFRIFLAVARSGSIAAAANQISESPATVGRKLRELESALSATLFERSVSGVELTACGSEILRRAEQMENHALLMSEAVAGRDAQLSGTVTVAAPIGFGQSLLAPQIRELHNLYPGLKVQLLLATSKVKMLNREADVAVRMAAQKQERLDADHCGDVRFGLYASHLYLDDIPPFQTVRDLEGHNVIAASGDLAQTVQWKEFSSCVEQCNVALSTDSIFAQLEAVKSGLGITPLPKYLGQQHPDLIEILPGQLRNTTELWLLTHPDCRNLARVQIVRAFVKQVCDAAVTKF
ncbi:MAG: LysR family transcriptional regulator [Arenibacterium sp.]